MERMIRIELYGVLSERAGTSEVELPLEGPTDVAGVLDKLAARFPAMARDLPRAACAVGDSLVSRADTVTGEEPLVVLPPVSGG